MRYPMESRFTLLARDVAQMVDTWEIRAPIRVYRRFGDLFGITSAWPELSMWHINLEQPTQSWRAHTPPDWSIDYIEGFG